MFFIFISLVRNEIRAWQCSGEPFLHFSTYRFGTLATPHSRQRGLSRDVISPQDGQIRCDGNPMVCGFSLRLQASSRIVNNTISTPNEILVAFIRSDPSWRVLHRPSQSLKPRRPLRT